MMITIEFAPGVRVVDKSFSREWVVQSIRIESECVVYECERWDDEDRRIHGKEFYGSQLDLVDGESNEIFVKVVERMNG
jgi:hypothetical protein